MKLNLGLCALSIAAVLATAPAALAASAAVGGDAGVSVGTNANTGDASTSANANANANANGNVSTDHGMSALGVDISQAGNTTTSVQSFTSTLTSEQQAELKTRCDKVMASPESASADVLAFCKNSKM